MDTVESSWLEDSLLYPDDYDFTYGSSYSLNDIEYEEEKPQIGFVRFK